MFAQAVRGLARRSDLIRQLREERKWPVLGLETGGALEMKRVDRKQSLLKFGMIQDSLNSMGYKAHGLGTEELKLGALNLFTISPIATSRRGSICHSSRPT